MSSSHSRIKCSFYVVVNIKAITYRLVAYCHGQMMILKV